jgi:hypothetical protein
MSEPKLCPYREMYWFEPLGDGTQKVRGFGPCLQDKCAMWREKEEGDPRGFGPVYKVIGFCGLAGKP